MTSSQKSNTVANLLESYFSVDGALDHAEYILSISDLGDVREWLIDALNLDENTETEKISCFLAVLATIKNSSSSDPPFRPTSHVPPKDKKVTPTSFTQVPESFAKKLPEKPKKTIPPARTENRVECFCLAKVEIGGHPLIGNCLSCGRIICDVEDYGPCLSCGEAKERIHWLDVSESMNSAAVEHKDRLVQYDKEGTRRTKIYDDSTDWFAEGTDIWKGKEERETALRHAREFEQQKLLAKQQMKVEIDFATGQFRIKDKNELIAAVENDRDEKLADWIDSPTPPLRLIEKPQVITGNVLDKDSEELLSLIRDKLGKGPDIKNESVSIFSFLDEEDFKIDSR